MYTAENIKILEGLEPVRKRPGMYIGSTDIRGLHHLVWEILDNAIDEVMAGYANKITITLTRDNWVWIEDNGRGIPVAKNAKTKISTVETIFTILHAGGKFDDSAYKTAGGLHGVGSSVVNALSDNLICQVFSDKQVYEARFGDGGKITQPLTVVGETSKLHGTVVGFHPDPAIFGDLQLNPETMRERFQETAYLFPNLKLVFRDEVNDRTVTFTAPDGIVNFVEELDRGKQVISPIIRLQETTGEIMVELACQWTTDNNPLEISFANSVKTIEGGSHLNGFKAGVVNTINQYARKWNLLKEKEKNLEGDDIREGLTGIILVRVPEKIITYEGQTKNKLFTPAAFDAVKKVVDLHLGIWLDQHKKEGVEIIRQAILNRDARLAAKNARETNKKLKAKAPDAFISAKLTPAQSKDPALSEIFLVEGDSAGGSAKLGRDKRHQAILPLKGKVINVEKAKLAEILKNEEIRTIINCLNTGIGKEFNLGKLRYHKIIIMTDADVDGSHIQALLLTMFYRFMRPLVENGHVYIALPPLYKVTKKGTNRFAYAWDERELEQLKGEYAPYEIQRYKGLGEMNPGQLWETTMDPRQRKLLQIQVVDLLESERQVSTLMGEDVGVRKEWIDTHVDFDNEEE